MLPPLLLLICLSGQVLARTPPGVECLVMNLEYVQCFWNKNGIPEVNYTFSSRFAHETETNCSEYLSENGTNTGCIRALKKTMFRLHQFYTTLRNGSEVYHQYHKPPMKVKLKPPSNLTVKKGSDFNLWFYWNHTHRGHVKIQSQVQHRINNNIWEPSDVDDRQYYCIESPSNSSRYELQVRSKCGPDKDSKSWSDWSEPVVFNKSPNTTMVKKVDGSMSVWTPVHYVVGVIGFILLILLLMKHDRLRIIFISVVPKPSLKSPNFKDWFQFPKGLTKEDFKASYTDQACPVCEYTYVSPSDSSRCNSPDLTEDHDDCSITIAKKESEEPSSPAESSDVLSEEEQQVMV